MKYVSIDIETTGLNPQKHQILQFAAIVEDTENPLSFDDIPKFEAIFKYEEIIGEPIAIAMNIGLINNPQRRKLNKESYSFANSDITETYFYESKWKRNVNFPFDFYKFLMRYGVYVADFTEKPSKKMTVAGKNFNAFDKVFLSKLDDFDDKIKIHHRTIDPAILYVDWATDTELPSLSECKKRAGLEPTVAHDALLDAWDVIQLVRLKQ